MIKRFVVLTSLCALLLASCQNEEHKKEVEITFKATHPVQMDTTIVEDYVSQIQSIRHIELRAQERGYLEKIFVDEGQFVKKGQLLFQIMPNLYEAERQKAVAEVNYAEIEYQNTKKLSERNIVSPSELAMAKAHWAKSKAELALADVHLSFTKIRAPFDGFVGRFLVRPGSLLEEGELMTSLSDNSEMWVYFNVSEAEYLDYKTSVSNGELAKVDLLMANNQIFEFPGIVETIEADFNNETGNIPFRATFPNPKGLLRHGETGNIKMTVPLKNALLIPQKATYEVLDKKFVYVIDKEHKIKAREITIEASMEDLFAVSSGLRSDDVILLEGLRKVKEDQKVKFDLENPKYVINNLKVHAE
jgi:membrane fusion protein (multidrug efflux system)